MKKAMLILLAMALLVGSAVAEFNSVADSSGQKGCDKWNEGKCCENHFEHQGPCVEICPGSKPSDKCGCDHFFKGKYDQWDKKEKGQCDQCDKNDRCDQCDKNAFWLKNPEKHGANCFVFEKCAECGKTICDGRCDECGEKCSVYEYCPVCGDTYCCEHADGFCDRCGRDCYCFEKCECGHNHYFNGYCDECADRCFYGRCCHDFEGIDGHGCQDKCKDASTCEKYPEKCNSCMGKDDYANSETQVFTIYLGEEGTENAESGMQEGYPGMESMNPPMQDENKDQMNSSYPPA